MSPGATFVANFGQNVDDFAPFSYGLSRWGWWSPSTNSLEGMREIADGARSRGKAYTEAVTVQSYRPYAQSFWEAGGLANLMATWQGAIAEQADAVQMVTWNDYSESTQFAPSLGNDHVPLDISSYYLTWYKTGHQPKIVRNVLYLANRSQFVNAKPSRQTALAVAQPGDARSTRSRWSDSSPVRAWCEFTWAHGHTSTKPMPVSGPSRCRWGPGRSRRNSSSTESPSPRWRVRTR